MSSCRGRAEAFARRLSSKLRTLSSPDDSDDILQEDEPIIKGSETKSWVTANNRSSQKISHIQLPRHESVSNLDFECELESSESSLGECEYLRLEETSSNTPIYSAAESGCACTSSANSKGFDDVALSPDISVGASSSSLYYQATQISSRTREFVSVPADEKKKYDEESNNYCNLNDLEDYEDNEDMRVIEKSQINNKGIQTKSTNDSRDVVSSNRALQVQPRVIQELQKEIKQKISVFEAWKINDEKDYLQNFVSPPVLHAETDTLEFSQTFHPDEFTTLFITDKKILEKKLKNATGKLDGSLESEKHTSKTSNPSHLPGTVTANDDVEHPERVRRSSSLKTGKTPPETPGRKKIVRFADVLGLDLADVKTFLDEIPTISRSAFEDLEIIEGETQIRGESKVNKDLMPLFQQPGGLPSFLDLVRSKKVALENAVVTDHIDLTVTGSVRVCNLDFHKSVHIRYTLDNWRTFADLQANYVENSCDGFSDKFTFYLFGNSLQIGQRLEFAVRFQCRGQQFWDNNCGTNYCFQCFPASTTELNESTLILQSHQDKSQMGLINATTGEPWCTSFY